MKRLLSLPLLCILTLPVCAEELSHPRIGLVLSGGGARGAAHVGVLKVLEDMRIPIAAVAGTSMGALVGGAYASGVGADKLEKELTSADWDDLFVDDPPREEWPMRRKDDTERPAWDFTVGVRAGRVKLPKGALAGQKVELFFADLVKGGERVESFDELPIPYRAVATDLEDGGMRVFSDGSLPKVMRASMSVPGLFAPIEIDDRLYVDGGLVRNLPVDVARRMGVDLVIAINLGSSYLPRDRLQTVVGVMGQMVAILTEQNVQRSLAEIDRNRDVLILPDLGDIGSSDFKRAAEAIAAGERAARTAAPRLAHLSLSPTAYAAWRASRPSPPPPAGQVDEVRVVGIDRVDAALFEPLIENQQGQPFDRRQLESDIQDLYGRGDFERISYRVDRSAGRNLIIVDALEKSWGPGYLSFGLGFRSDFSGDNRLGLRGTYRRTWLNALGGEWLTSVQLGNELDLFSELYQPLRLDRAGFVAPYLRVSRSPISVFEGSQRVARYDLTRSAVGLDLGSTLFDERAELRVGALLGKARTKLDTGEPSLPETTNNESGLRASFRWDTLDSRYVPRSGTRLALDLFSPQSALGADVSYNRLSASWSGAKSFGKNTLVGRARLGSSFGSDMPFYDQFPLGGFQDLSGYANEQFRGNQVAFGALIYYRQLATLTPPLGRGIYLGGSLEVGSIQDTLEFLSKPKTRFGSSVFLGADTWLGPAYLGLGVGGEGDSTAYFLLGRP
ncbi:MAG: patatin-like phospholipase family protein [Pseudomonadota bacterium]|nr:patatin-like phospholipase family protein [Pseudomonadota bacterium]